MVDQINIMDLATQVDCDPAVEDCSSGPIEWPETSPRSLYIFAGIGLLNSVLPQLYYVLSSDFSGKYVEKDDEENLEITKRERPWGRYLARFTSPRVREYDDDDDDDDKENKRGRGSEDDSIWSKVAGSHDMLWGVGNLFFVLSVFGQSSKAYSWYIEHWMSNLMPLIYLFNMVMLSINASKTGDVQSFLELAAYVVVFPGVFYIMQASNGVSALKYLNRAYPYNDTLLLPSLLYKIGVLEHTDRMNQNIQVDVDPQGVPFKSDPSAADDTIIDNFLVTF